MSGESVKIKEYVIPKVYVDIASSPKEEFEVVFNMEANIMIPKDTEDRDCIIEIKLEYIDEEKKQTLREIAVPIFYKELRKFLGEISERTKLDFPNIPLLEEIDI